MWYTATVTTVDSLHFEMTRSDYTFSNGWMIEKVTTAEGSEEDQNEKLLVLPVRCYVATSIRVHRNAWEDSISWGGTDGTPLTWTRSRAESAAGPTAILIGIM